MTADYAEVVAARQAEHDAGKWDGPIDCEGAPLPFRRRVSSGFLGTTFVHRWYVAHNGRMLDHHHGPMFADCPMGRAGVGR